MRLIQTRLIYICTPGDFCLPLMRKIVLSWRSTRHDFRFLCVRCLKVHHRGVRRRPFCRVGLPQGRSGRQQPGLGQADGSHRLRFAGPPRCRQAPPRQGEWTKRFGRSIRRSVVFVLLWDCFSFIFIWGEGGVYSCNAYPWSYSRGPLASLQCPDGARRVSSDQADVAFTKHEVP